MNIVSTLHKIEEKIHDIFYEGKYAPSIIIMNNRTWDDVVLYFTGSTTLLHMHTELKYKNLKVYRSEDIKDGQVEVY